MWDRSDPHVFHCRSGSSFFSCGLRKITLKYDTGRKFILFVYEQLEPKPPLRSRSESSQKNGRLRLRKRLSNTVPVPGPAYPIDCSTLVTRLHFFLKFFSTQILNLRGFYNNFTIFFVPGSGSRRQNQKGSTRIRI